MTTPAVYYPKNLPGTLVVEADGAVFAVPMRRDGWASRYLYIGHRASLTPVPANEAEIQLRTTEWKP